MFNLKEKRYITNTLNRQTTQIKLHNVGRTYSSYRRQLKTIKTVFLTQLVQYFAAQLYNPSIHRAFSKIVLEEKFDFSGALLIGNISKLETKIFTCKMENFFGGDSGI